MYGVPNKSVYLYYPHYTQGLASAQTVTLTSSVEQDGRQAACPGEVVTFTCTVTDGVALSWTAEPYITMMDPIRFLVSATLGQTAMDDSGQFRARLTSVIPSGLFGDLTSELTVTVSESLNVTVVQCLATATIMRSKTLTLAGTNEYLFQYCLLQNISTLPSPSLSSPAAKVLCFTVPTE